jgi:citrate lyase subunit beta/citryl-CoA lyase
VPISLLKLDSYVDASARLEGLTWGAEDLAGVIGSAANREPDGRWTSPYQLVRSLCLFTAAAANAQPIDTVFVNFRDAEGLRAEAQEAARDGFTGKMAIHPNQVAVINELFTPRPEEIAVSEEIVKAFADNPQVGVIGIRGQMIDRPHLVRAERILARAKAVRG